MPIAVSRRHRGMTGGGMRGHDQGGIALLGKADQGGWFFQTFDDAVSDEEAFIDHVIEPDIARGKERDDSFCATGTRDFLVMAKGEIDSSFRAKPLLPIA